MDLLESAKVCVKRLGIQTSIEVLGDGILRKMRSEFAAKRYDGIQDFMHHADFIVERILEPVNNIYAEDWLREQYGNKVDVLSLKRSLILLFLADSGKEHKDSTMRDAMKKLIINSIAI